MDTLIVNYRSGHRITYEYVSKVVYLDNYLEIIYDNGSSLTCVWLDDVSDVVVE